MESALHQRDHIGVQDTVLLENYESEDAFLENLRKRFKANLIYVSVPVVLVCAVWDYASMVQFCSE
jgi:myosin-1